LAEKWIQEIELGAGLANAEYPQYQHDPAGFGKNVLGEEYTDDAIAVMESVRDNIVTLAKSGNGTGKTHVAARIAVWWTKCFIPSQVYTASAPPLENLTRLLWGEIGGIIQRHPALFENDKVGALSVTRNPQHFLTGVAIPSTGSDSEREAKFSGKHSPYLLFILDEGDAIPSASPKIDY